MFISQLIDDLTTQLHIDKQRVFVTGFSFGASMAYRLGCELSAKVAAIAPVSGALVFAACHPTRPVSVLMMQGTADSIFPYQGGGDYSIPPVAGVARLWAGLDGCAGVGVQSRTGIITTTRWHSCRAGAAVRLDLISGAPHTWFGGEPNPVAGEPSANSAVWGFFSSLP
jgi:polyhydroxybutyrate depolymerase